MTSYRGGGSPGMAGTSTLLREFGLSKNPFTDRTAERSQLDLSALYMHSDLQGFEPSETTYVIFGRRGSGKTTIRLQMEDAYTLLNSSERAPFFMVDLCSPSTLTACLRVFLERIGCGEDAWDAAFSTAWTSADLIDCMLAFSLTRLVDELLSADSAKLDALRKDWRLTKQLLLCAHMYSMGDSASLAELRRRLMAGGSHLRTVAAGIGVGVGLAACGAGLSKLGGLEAAGDAGRKLVKELGRCHHPKLAAAGLASGAALLWGTYDRRSRAWQRSRAAAISNPVRVAPRRNLEGLLGSLFTPEDTAEGIRSQYVGVSAQQKLELLTLLVRGCGYRGLAIFGDCFDEVGLLDPVRYPSAIKRFAREACRNDVLSFGRMALFFPDSRVGLDLSTTQVLQEARFDRHMVKELTWSRQQLAALAERRFRAFQLTRGAQGPNPLDAPRDFRDLFEKVSIEDFHSSLAKLHTPRELMIMMTEMLQRLEANQDGGYCVAAQDMEIAVARAAEQAL